MFHFHKWTDWVVTERGKFIYLFNEVKGTYLIQTRCCSKCGKTQINRQSSSFISISYSLVPETITEPEPQLRMDPKSDKNRN